MLNSIIFLVVMLTGIPAMFKFGFWLGLSGTVAPLLAYIAGGGLYQTAYGKYEKPWILFSFGFLHLALLLLWVSYTGWHIYLDGYDISGVDECLALAAYGVKPFTSLMTKPSIDNASAADFNRIAHRYGLSLFVFLIVAARVWWGGSHWWAILPVWLSLSCGHEMVKANRASKETANSSAFKPVPAARLEPASTHVKAILTSETAEPHSVPHTAHEFDGIAHDIAKLLRFRLEKSISNVETPASAESIVDELTRAHGVEGSRIRAWFVDEYGVPPDEYQAKSLLASQTKGPVVLSNGGTIKHFKFDANALRRRSPSKNPVPSPDTTFDLWPSREMQEHQQKLWRAKQKAETQDD